MLPDKKKEIINDIQNDNLNQKEALTQLIV